MKNFLKKIKNNRGDLEPMMFVYGTMLAFFFIYLTFDLTTVAWSRYTIKREALNLSRVYALKWVDSIWDPSCMENEALAERCLYGSVRDSKLAEDIEMMSKSAAVNGGFSSLTMMITTNPQNDTSNCRNALFCVTTNSPDGTSATSQTYAWSIDNSKIALAYGTDLYLVVEGTVPYRFAGNQLGLPPLHYTVYNKFASERQAKTE